MSIKNWPLGGFYPGNSISLLLSNSFWKNLEEGFGTHLDKEELA